MLDLWTIYCNPKDYPTSFVARRWVILHGQAIPTKEAIVCDTLDEVRGFISADRVRLRRDLGDEDHIVECWV